MTDLSNDATDDGFHEIQLSGKQLVFLFMATTVVSVVIFLCGVLVGRGVRGEALAASSNKPAMSAAGPAPTAVDTTPAPGTPPQVEETTPPPDNKLSYADRLAAEKPVDEHLAKKTAAPVTAPVPPPPTTQQATGAAGSDAATKAPTPAAKGTFSPPSSASAPAQDDDSGSARKPARGTWAVQVVALTDKAAASAVVERLIGKGYNAFLVAPQPGSAVKNYKVQIGRFDERSEAQTVADRLKKEEQFVPWILR